MTEEVRLNDWSKGANNVAAASRLPEGFARDMLNLYPAGGRLTLRPGTEAVYAGGDVRGLFSVRGQLVCVDGGNLVDALTGTTLASVPPRGAVSGAVLNSELYLSVGSEQGVYSPLTGYRSWGVPTPTTNGVSTGTDLTRSLEARRRGTALRRYTVTFVDSSGVEGGALPGSALGGRVQLPAPPDGMKVRLYTTEPDGSVYYMQGEYADSQTVSIGGTNAGGRQLHTMFMGPPPPAEFMAVSGGCLVLADANFVYHTPPMNPHLVDPEGGVFMYPEPVTALCAGLGGLYLSADKCYKLTGIGSDTVRQTVVLEYPAIPNTMTTLPDGAAAWVTEYGAALEVVGDRGDTTVVEPTKQTHVLGKPDGVAGGSVEHNGERMFIANVRDTPDRSPLAATGFFEAEVTRP